jgi:hypothetical protein
LFIQNEFQHAGEQRALEAQHGQHPFRELATVSMLSALPGAESPLQSHMRISMNVGLTASQLRQLTQVLADRWTPTMPGVRARRWSGNWPPNPEADVSEPVEL